MTDEITLDAPETRIERFLAAAAGVEGITLDEPVTRIEKYLYKIAQGSGGVPAVEDADKGKYLHANESTGDLEWATAGGSGGGGVLVVHLEQVGDDGVLDKTWAEIDAADVAVIVYSGGIFHSREFVASTEAPDGSCIVRTIVQTPTGSVSKAVYITDTADGYPVRQQN